MNATFKTHLILKMKKLEEFIKVCESNRITTLFTQLKMDEDSSWWSLTIQGITDERDLVVQHKIMDRKGNDSLESFTSQIDQNYYVIYEGSFRKVDSLS